MPKSANRLEILRSVARLCGSLTVTAVALLIRQWERAGVLPLEPFASPEEWYERQCRRLREVCPLGALPPAPIVYFARSRALLNRIDPLALGGDVLGPAYDACETRSNKKQAGRYMTPPLLADTLLDLAGFSGMETPSLNEGLLDCSCGVGTFLAQAAARVAHQTAGDSTIEPLTAVRYILRNLVGIERDPAAALLARINVLLQLGPLLRRWTGPVQTLVDTLKNGPAIYATDGLSCYRGDLEDPIPGRSFRWCVGNPPYIGEMHHRSLFREARARRLVARQYYHKDMDYLYWFLIAGLSRLAPGGRLAYVTSAYWPEAESAAFLRKYITDHADVERVILLGQTQLFEHAPGHHSLLIVLRRKAMGAKPLRTKIVQIDTTGSARRSLPDVLRRVRSADTTSYSPVMALSADPWPLRVTPDLHHWLVQLETNAQPLAGLVHIRQGIQTGANVVTPALYDLLWRSGAADGVQVGDGVFVLTERELAALRPSRLERQRYIRPLCKTCDIRPWRAQPPDRYVIVLRDDDDLSQCPQIAAHLARFRQVLERRREFDPQAEGEAVRPWHASKRAREPNLFDGPKIITPQHARVPSFALAEDALCVATDARLLVPKNEALSLPALVAVLNSSLLAQWFQYRLKRKGETLEFYGQTFARTPIPLNLPPVLEDLALTCLEQGGPTPAQQQEIDRHVATLFDVPFASPEAVRVV